jgi:hypothetical protein
MVLIGKTCRRRRRHRSSTSLYHYQCRLNLGWMILIIPLLHLTVANDIPFVCHVCGEGQQVTRPYGVVTFPNQVWTTCMNLRTYSFFVCLVTNHCILSYSAIKFSL